MGPVGLYRGGLALGLAMQNGNAASGCLAVSARCIYIVRAGRVATRPPGDTPGARLRPRRRSNGATVMDAIIKKLKTTTLPADIAATPATSGPRPSREEAEAAVRTLLAFAGDDPGREGLLDTPKRVVSAYEEIYAGYRECPADILDRTFAETGGYDDLVLVRDIPFHSHCEHHMMPFYGKAHVAYLPVERVVG